MKKACLLSGIMVFGFAVNVSAMQQPIYGRIAERPEMWQHLDVYTSTQPVDWDNVFKILNKYQNQLPSEGFRALVNKYRDPRYGKSLVDLAVQEGQKGVAYYLIRGF